jgi:hypothetical protein
MTKRMAIVIAGALVGAMMSGVVALTFGRGVVGVPARAAVSPAPIVKTETKVITIKKRRPAKPAPEQTITVIRSGGATTHSGATEYQEAEVEGEGNDD